MALIAIFAMGAVSTVGNTMNTVFWNPLPTISSAAFAALLGRAGRDGRRFGPVAFRTR